MKNYYQTVPYERVVRMIARRLAERGKVKKRLAKLDAPEHHVRRKLNERFDYIEDELWHTEIFAVALLDRPVAEVEEDAEELFRSSREEEGEK